MQVKWSSAALNDLVRLHAFLADVNPRAAAKVVQSLTGAVDGLLQNPRLGLQLAEFSPDEVRRIIVGAYEVRYAIVADVIHIVRLWHTREER